MANQPVPNVVLQALDSLCQPQPMRRGSFSERYVKCGKPNCACQGDPQARHGPYYSWTRVVKGKTQSRFIDSTQADTMRAQIAAGQEFRQGVEAYWTACERWADQQLETSATASTEEAEKKGSPRRSRRKSAKRSKRS